MLHALCSFISLCVSSFTPKPCTHMYKPVTKNKLRDIFYVLLVLFVQEERLVPTPKPGGMYRDWLARMHITHILPPSRGASGHAECWYMWVRCTLLGAWEDWGLCGE